MLLGNPKGQTLPEIVAALAVISIGALGFMKAFGSMSQALYRSRYGTIAVNLAQEKIESLKNLSYYDLLVTTAPATQPQLNFQYDTVDYAPESFSYWGGETMTRAVYVGYAAPENGKLVPEPYTASDPGLKMITVTVYWNDNKGWHDVVMTNLKENPNIAALNATITGTVSDTAGGYVDGAVVSVLGSPQWSAQTNSNGLYLLSVAAGSYTVTASSLGFTSASSGLLSAPASQSVTQNFSLSPISSGAVAAMSVFFSSHIVISQIVADTQTVVADGTTQGVEYVELFNGTTYPIDLASTPSPACPDTGQHYNLSYICGGHGSTGCSPATPSGGLNPNLCFISTYVPAGSFFLIANTSMSFTVAGATAAAPDAYFGPNYSYLPGSNPSPAPFMQTPHGGSMQLLDANNNVVDEVGWVNKATGNLPYDYLGNIIVLAGGIQTGDQIVRMSSPCAEAVGYGRAYDTQDNANNFFYDYTGGGFFLYPPYGIDAGTFTSQGGFPALGGFASVDDGLSSPVEIASATSFNFLGPGETQGCYYGYFNIPNVATGTWTVVVASGNLEMSVSSVSLPSEGATTLVLSTATSPAISLSSGVVPLTESAWGGYVAGTVSDALGQPLSGITVTGQGAAQNAVTGPSGVYFLALDSGTGITITANPNQLNPIYVSQAVNLDISIGELATYYFELSEGGGIKGYATTGTTPVPGAVFVASNTEGGSGTGVTDNTGTFYIQNLATGTYTVTPELSNTQSSDPAQVFDLALNSPGATVSAGTFTISGVLGTFAGTVSGAGGRTITTGVLIIASTESFSSPPIIYGASVTGQAFYYTTASRPDGTYVLPVRGSSPSNSYTYNIMAVYSTVNLVTGAAVTAPPQLMTGSVDEGATTTINFTGL